MGEGSHFLDIILLVLVAGFILLRLRSVLGRRTGFEQQPPPGTPLAAPPGEKPVAQPDDKVIPLDRNRPAGPAPAIAAAAAAGLARIGAADRSFSPVEFLEGAKGAYEMSVGAFAAGDANGLRALVSSEVHASFLQAIEARRKAGEKQETTLVGIKSAEIVSADLRGSMADVTIRFVSELVNATRDASGKVIAGNPNAVEDVTDVWTFARDTRSRDPNWTLIDTSAAA